MSDSRGWLPASCRLFGGSRVIDPPPNSLAGSRRPSKLPARWRSTAAARRAAAHVGWGAEGGLGGLAVFAVEECHLVSGGPGGGAYLEGEMSSNISA